MTSLAMYRVHCGGGGCCGPESNHAISIYHVSKLNCDNSENQAPRHANVKGHIHPCTLCNVGVEVAVGQRPVMPSVSMAGHGTLAPAPGTLPMTPTVSSL